METPGRLTKLEECKLRLESARLIIRKENRQKASPFPKTSSSSPTTTTITNNNSSSSSDLKDRRRRLEQLRQERLQQLQQQQQQPTTTPLQEPVNDENENDQTHTPIASDTNTDTAAAVPDTNLVVSSQPEGITKNELTPLGKQNNAENDVMTTPSSSPPPPPEKTKESLPSDSAVQPTTAAAAAAVATVTPSPTPKGQPKEKDPWGSVTPEGTVAPATTAVSGIPPERTTSPASTKNATTITTTTTTTTTTTLGKDPWDANATTTAIQDPWDIYATRKQKNNKKKKISNAYSNSSTLSQGGNTDTNTSQGTKDEWSASQTIKKDHGVKDSAHLSPNAVTTTSTSRNSSSQKTSLRPKAAVLLSTKQPSHNQASKWVSTQASAATNDSRNNATTQGPQNELEVVSTTKPTKTNEDNQHQSQRDSFLAANVFQTLFSNHPPNLPAPDTHETSDAVKNLHRPRVLFPEEAGEKKKHARLLQGEDDGPKSTSSSWSSVEPPRRRTPVDAAPASVIPNHLFQMDSHRPTSDSPLVRTNTNSRFRNPKSFTTYRGDGSLTEESQTFAESSTASVSASLYSSLPSSLPSPTLKPSRQIRKKQQKKSVNSNLSYDSNRASSSLPKTQRQKEASSPYGFVVDMVTNLLSPRTSDDQTSSSKKSVRSKGEKNGNQQDRPETKIKDKLTPEKLQSDVENPYATVADLISPVHPTTTKFADFFEKEEPDNARDRESVSHGSSGNPPPSDGLLQESSACTPTKSSPRVCKSILVHAQDTVTTTKSVSFVDEKILHDMERASPNIPANPDEESIDNNNIEPEASNLKQSSPAGPLWRFIERTKSPSTPSTKSASFVDEDSNDEFEMQREEHSRMLRLRRREKRTFVLITTSICLLGTGTIIAAIVILLYSFP